MTVKEVLNVIYEGTYVYIMEGDNNIKYGFIHNPISDNNSYLDREVEYISGVKDGYRRCIVITLKTNDELDLECKILRLEEGVRSLKTMVEFCKGKCDNNG